MCGLVEVHEVHVDFVVGELFVRLCVEVRYRLLQAFESFNPHFRGRERVHPHDNADAAQIIFSHAAGCFGFFVVSYDGCAFNGNKVAEL